MASSPRAPIRVDIVSDVVCPWCAIGYLQLARAAETLGLAIDVHWHPFELNSQMAMEGEKLFDHLARKYGITPAQSQQNRTQITQLGAELGFTFAFSDDMFMWNTFRAHQLIEWAEEQDRAHDAKLALLAAHFTDRRNVSDQDTLADIARDIGLDRQGALDMLNAGTHAESVRKKQAFWTSQGVQGVPAMIFAQRYAATGAQGVAGYRRILENLMTDQVA
ncbi:MAG: DsbA family oxidoreductase [Aestuariivita sp.]|uniref:DsbA family oxidoreductase n=1 Tax=Aestuariivita sp. TaxID=1872407 RepID=UPI003BB0E07A